MCTAGSTLTILSSQVDRRREMSGSIEDTTISSVFESLIAADPDRVVFVCAGTRLTAAHLGRRVDGFATWMMRRGIEQGSRVGIWMPNGMPWLVAHLAAAKIGAVSVPVSTRLTGHEAKYILTHSGSQVVVAPDAFLGRRYGKEAAALLGESEVELVVVDPINGELPEASGPDVSGPFSPDEAAIIQYTSGTTGAPKGCVLSHRAWTNNARLSASVAHLSEEDVVFSPSPFFHLFGSLTALMGAMSVGATLVTLPAYGVDSCISAMDAEGVTHLVAVPTVWLDLMEAAEPTTFPKFKGGVWGGASFPRNALERALDTKGFGWNLQAIYGMTECPTISQVAPDDELEVKIETVGAPTPHVEVRITDPTSWKEVDAGEAGEIWARGYNRMLGYFENPTATNERMTPDGWIRTGDLGMVDVRGVLRVVGRITDMIISGGANIYAREVEDALLEVPGIGLAAVVAAPDHRLGEVPVAWVSPAAGRGVKEQEVLDHCSARLAKYKVPKRVFIVDVLPLTESGKIHKARLRELTAQWEASGH